MSDYPVGTVDEVVAIGLRPDRVRTCAPESPGVRGCEHWETCLFSKLKGHGPENVGYYKILRADTPDETGNGFVLPCYTVMDAEYQLMMQTHVTKSIYSPFRYPGEKVIRTFTEKVHPQKDPKCQECGKNSCNKMHTVEREIEVPKFPRPVSVFTKNTFHNKIKGEVRGTEQVNFERRIAGLKPKDRDDDEGAAGSLAAQMKK